MAPTLQQHLAADGGPKRILSLDGGGVKGILTLGMLTALEAELRRRAGGDPNFRLSDYYDLIGGTSTGAIIATGLALGLSVADLIELYSTLGPRVFKRKRGTGYFFKPAYDHRELSKALAPVLKDIRLGDQHAIKTGLSIHMKRIDTGSPWVVSNHPASPYYNPHDPETIPNRYYQLADLVRASAAAPTYFDEVLINTKFGKNFKPIAPGYFVDGAVSANNNPGIQLLLTAIVPQYGFGWKAGADHLMMTSLGTGIRRPRAKRGLYAIELSGMKAIAALRAMIYDTQIQGVALMQALSAPRMPWNINTEIQTMIGGPFSGAAVLDYQRMDASLELRSEGKGLPSDIREPGFLGIGGRNVHPAPAEKLLNELLPKKVLRRLDELANGDPENIDLLLRIGEKVGATYVSDSYPDPKFDLPGWPQQ